MNKWDERFMQLAETVAEANTSAAVASVMMIFFVYVICVALMFCFINGTKV